MRFLRLLVAALAATAPALLAPAAQAQSATPANPEWSGRPSTDLQLNQINQADCLASNATITFNVTVTTGTSTSTVLQVWAGTACGTKTNRDKNTSCNMVFEADDETQNVTVKVKDILQEPAEGAGIDTGTEETCRPSSGASGGIKHALFFLIIDQSTGEVVGTPGQWEFTYDLVPPDPPSGVTAGPGENSLTLEFTEPNDDDLDRYRFYCSQEDSATPESCSSSALVAGEPPPTGVASCGSTSATAKSSGQTDDNLQNGLNYAVAVAAVDKLGNVGVLSNIGCAQPQEVTGYFEAYRAAGGQAGGGFCSFAAPRGGALPLALAALYGLALVARRRR